MSGTLKLFGEEYSAKRRGKICEGYAVQVRELCQECCALGPGVCVRFGHAYLFSFECFLFAGLGLLMPVGFGGGLFGRGTILVEEDIPPTANGVVFVWKPKRTLIRRLPSVWKV
jgi:hypothetical protein